MVFLMMTKAGFDFLPIKLSGFFFFIIVLVHCTFFVFFLFLIIHFVSRYTFCWHVTAGMSNGRSPERPLRPAAGGRGGYVATLLFSALLSDRVFFFFLYIYI